MPIMVYCSKCAKTYSVQDVFAGQRGRCPKGHPVQIPSLGAAAPVNTAGTQVPPPLPAAPPLPRREDPPSSAAVVEGPSSTPTITDTPHSEWAKVKSGLSFLAASQKLDLGLVVLGIPLGFLLGSRMVGAFRRSDELVSAVTGILAILFGFGELIVLVLWGIALSYCCTAPEPARVSGKAYASLVTGVLGWLGFIVPILFLVPGFSGSSRELLHSPALMGLMCVGIAATGLLVTSGILLLLFLKGIGQYFGKQSLVESVRDYFKFAFLYVGGMLLVFFFGVLVSIMMHSDGAVKLARVCQIAMGIANLVATFGFGIWRIQLVGRARNTVAVGQVHASTIRRG